MDPTIEPIPTLKPTLDFSELVMVPKPITLEPKSSNSLYHVPLLDIGIDHNNSMMNFQDWSYEGDNFHDRILHNPIGDYKYINRKEVNKGGFRKPPHYFDG